MEARFGDMVRRVVHRRRTCVYGRCGRELHRAGSEERKSVVAFPVWRERLLVADDVLGRREAVRGRRGGLDAVRVRLALDGVAKDHWISPG